MIDQNKDVFVCLKDVDYSYQGNTILRNVDILAERGKITAIMGPSGVGKTTLLRLIGAQLAPDKGNINVDGHFIHHLNKKDRMALRRRMGLLFQSGALFTNLSVFENVAFPLREHTALPASMIRDIVLMKLQAVGLRGAHQLMTSQLSGGMARRVALARAIALDPELVMYDEPFTGQDPITMGVLIKLITTLNKSLGMTTIIVSHDVQETVSIADYIYLLANGEVVAEGTPEQITQHQSPQVKQFMHGLADGVVPFHYPAPSYQEDLIL